MKVGYYINEKILNYHLIKKEFLFVKSIVDLK
jgi:hypothetical protein